MLWVVGDSSEVGTSSGDEGREEVGLEVSEGARLEEVGLKDSGGTFEDVGEATVASIKAEISSTLC